VIPKRRWGRIFNQSALVLALRQASSRPLQLGPGVAFAALYLGKFRDQVRISIDEGSDFGLLGLEA
jgi:hypothetical protein